MMTLVELRKDDNRCKTKQGYFLPRRVKPKDDSAFQEPPKWKNAVAATAAPPKCRPPGRPPGAPPRGPPGGPGPPGRGGALPVAPPHKIASALGAPTGGFQPSEGGFEP